MTSLLLTVEDAAEALAISSDKLDQLLDSGALVSIRIDGCLLIPIGSLHLYVLGLACTEAAV
uniref:helix-turn-helix domain-containing protein n=1 Tax=Herbidospora sakaeratensis TaxID=564415 RepID=UPI0007835189|nr:helix-turn-helix domain-containing protein [Herbidospora sakaeratensis]